MLTYHKHKEMIIRWKKGVWSLLKKYFLMTEVAFRAIFERCNRKCALLSFTAAIPRTQETHTNAGTLPSLSSSSAGDSSTQNDATWEVCLLKCGDHCEALCSFCQSHKCFTKSPLPRSSTFPNGQCPCSTSRLLF